MSVPQYKLKCIDIGEIQGCFADDLIVGKIYDVADYGTRYWVRNELGERCKYFKERFDNTIIVRKQKLEKLNYEEKNRTN